MMKILTLDNISKTVEEVEGFLDQFKIERKEKLRIQFGIEEALNTFREHFGDDAKFDIKLGSVFGRCKIQLTVPGENFDPFLAGKDEDESSAMMRSMLTTLGKRPAFNYTHKSNVLTFSTERKPIPEWAKLVVAIASAIACATIVRFFPENVQEFIQADLFNPLLNTFLGFLNAVAGPMIFLAVVWGIYSMGDVDTFSKLGKVLSTRFFIYITIWSVIAGLLALPFFDLKLGTGTLGNSFSAVYQMILDIVPTNLFTPFSRGNTLQILFVAIIIGISMIMIGEKTQYIAQLSEQLNLIVNGIMGFIGRLVPYFIFGSVFNLVLSSDVGAFKVAVKFFFGNILTCSFIMLGHLIVTSLVSKLPIIQIMKNSLSTFIIALTTASSSASFADNVSTCINKYKIDSKLANFGVPFVQVLYKPGVSMVYYCAVISMAEYNGVEVSAEWIITALLMCIILSAATPPIPGGSTASFSVLFLQLGIPIESLAVVLSLNIILDFFHTSANIFCGQCLLVDAAYSTNK